MIKRSILSLCAIIAAVAAPPVTGPRAQMEPGSAMVSRPVSAVIELFTSQGCSSCPAADALLKDIAASHKDVMALSLPVDIWDYIGWKDTLASPKNSERQRAYSRLLGSGPVYTPQMVINGVAQSIGSDAREVDMAMAKAKDTLRSKHVPVQIWPHRNSVVIEMGEAPAGVDVKESTIWLAVVQKSVDVQVTRGENAGSTLTYHNVVRELTPVGAWSGKAATIQLLRSSFMRPDIEDVIVLIQEADFGPIVGAAWLGL
jgi:hypothetical protein